MVETIHRETAVENEVHYDAVAESDLDSQKSISQIDLEVVSSDSVETTPLSNFSLLTKSLLMPTLWNARRPISLLSRSFMPAPLLLAPPSLIEKGAEAVLTSVDVFMNAEDDKGLSSVGDYWSQESTKILNGLNDATGFEENGFSLSGFYNGGRFLTDYEFCKPFEYQLGLGFQPGYRFQPGFGYHPPLFDMELETLPPLSSYFGGRNSKNFNDETIQTESPTIVEEDDSFDYLSFLEQTDTQEEIEKPRRTSNAWSSSSSSAATTPTKQIKIEEPIEIVNQELALSTDESAEIIQDNQKKIIIEHPQSDEIEVAATDTPDEDKSVVVKETQTTPIYGIIQPSDADIEQVALDEKTEIINLQWGFPVVLEINYDHKDLYALIELGGHRIQTVPQFAQLELEYRSLVKL